MCCSSPTARFTTTSTITRAPISMTTWYRSGCAGRMASGDGWRNSATGGAIRFRPRPSKSCGGSTLSRIVDLDYCSEAPSLGGRAGPHGRGVRAALRWASRPSAPSARPRRAIAYSSYLGRLRGGRDRRSAAMQPGTYYTAAVPRSRLMNVLFIRSTDFLRCIAPPILRKSRIHAPPASAAPRAGGADAAGHARAFVESVPGRHREDRVAHRTRSVAMADYGSLTKRLRNERAESVSRR